MLDIRIKEMNVIVTTIDSKGTIIRVSKLLRLSVMRFNLTIGVIIVKVISCMIIAW